MFFITPLLLASLAAAWPLNNVALPIRRQNSNLSRRLESTCTSSSSILSCSTNATKGTCCLEAPSGLLAQTQFWDASPARGPADSWTIHGLWPDKCDGTFESNCDKSREQSGVTNLLESHGAQETLQFMQTFWKDINGDDEQFWEHEWNKHGTCMSTLESSCFPSNSPKGTDAVVYFQKVVEVFKSVPTYKFLSERGILPSSTKTYAASDIVSAIKAASGHTAQISCKGSNLSQIYYYFHIDGSVIDGQFVAIDAPNFEKSDCPADGIKYLPKDGAEPAPTEQPPATATNEPTETSSDEPVPTDEPSSSTGPRPTPTPTESVPTSDPSPSDEPTNTNTAGGEQPTNMPSSFKVAARQSAGDITGGLISSGAWSSQTPATYSAVQAGNGFALSSRKGACAITGGELSCGTGSDGTVFTTVTGEDGAVLLAYQGSTEFSADAVPNGSDQEVVYAGAAHATQFELVISA